MTDHHTDRLFDLPGAHRCVFPVSRLVVDPERFIDDPIESFGMGVVYTHTAAGEALRAISEIDRLALINSYYHPHHTALTRMADECLEKHNQCLIIDCHSFPAQPLPYENDLNRPDICIGTDAFHTQPELEATLVNSFQEYGYSVAINSPFAGSLVPIDFYRKEPRVQSIMVELNRGLYSTPDKLSKLQIHLEQVLMNLCKNDIE
jgi:N-formylglutamate amidohydrolase